MDTMDTNMYELVRKILWGVGFIAMGGTLMAMFLLVFAQSIFGCRTIHAQLERLLGQTERMSEQMERIAENLEKGRPTADRGAPGAGEGG